MKRILTKVTVTGADNCTAFADMRRLQLEFPYAEFGILISPNYSIGLNSLRPPRFPSRTWLRELVTFQKDEGGLQLSGHVCGAWVRQIFKGQWPNINVHIPELTSIFQRFQLNTHAEPHESVDDIRDVFEILPILTQTVIFQLDGRDGAHMAQRMYGRMFEFGALHHLAGLFDLSHGAGILPEEWPKPYRNMYCGYAGGLSPENVGDQLKKIEIACGGNPTWIDAETHLMGDNGRFDINKAAAFLKAAEPWVIKNEHKN